VTFGEEGIFMAKKRFKSLYDAVQNGAPTDVRQLLAAGEKPNEAEEAGDVTALMYAAQRGDLEIVKALVEGGADVNAVAEDLSGDLDEFEYLDEAFQAAELHGMTALVYAIVYGHTKVKTYLFKLTNPKLQKQAKAVERRARQHEDEGE
jgi:ankyrin repeat protein